MTTDKEITRALANHIGTARELVECLEEKGLVDKAEFRLTVEARREKAQELVDSGMSQRQAARELGVHHSTIQDDLAEYPPEHGGISATKAESIRMRNDEVMARPVDIPDDRFETIVIDPPWPMAKIERDVRPNQVEFDYPVMSEQQLEEFPATIGQIALDDCHMFMWTTQKVLPIAMRLIDHYGFRYVLTMVWHKPGGYQPTGLPQFNCEFAIYARKGTPKFIDTKGFPCCFNAPRREHSRKPDEFYDDILSFPRELVIASSHHRYAQESAA